MALSVTHSTVVAVPDDGTSPVGTNEWNAAHTISGTVDAAGSNTQVQFNDGGALAGDSDLTWDKTSSILRLGNTANAALRVYNVDDGSSNWERGVFDWVATTNMLTIGAQKNGTGTLRNVRFLGDQMYFAPETAWNLSPTPTGTNSHVQYYPSGNVFTFGNGIYVGWNPNANITGANDVGFTRIAAGLLELGSGAGSSGVATYLRLNEVAVASLPAASSTYKGARGTVNNANATTFNSVVAGGGSNIVPVFCDGTNWRIG